MQRFTACFAGCSSSSEPPVRWIHRRRNVLVSVSLVRPLLPYAWITRQAADVYHSVEVQPTLPDAVRRYVAAPKAPPLRDRHSCKVLSCWAVLPDLSRTRTAHGSLAGVYVLSALGAVRSPSADNTPRGTLCACTSRTDSSVAP